MNDFPLDLWASVLAFCPTYTTLYHAALTCKRARIACDLLPRHHLDTFTEPQWQMAFSFSIFGPAAYPPCQYPLLLPVFSQLPYRLYCTRIKMPKVGSEGQLIWEFRRDDRYAAFICERDQLDPVLLQKWEDWVARTAARYAARGEAIVRFLGLGPNVDIHSFTTARTHMLLDYHWEWVVRQFPKERHNSNGHAQPRGQGRRAVV